MSRKKLIVLRVVGGQEPESSYTFVRVVEDGGNKSAIAAAKTKLAPGEENEGQIFAHNNNRAKSDQAPYDLPVGTLLTCRGIGHMIGKKLPHLEEWSAITDQAMLAEIARDLQQKGGCDGARIKPADGENLVVTGSGNAAGDGAAAEGDGQSWTGAPPVRRDFMGGGALPPNERTDTIDLGEIEIERNGAD